MKLTDLKNIFHNQLDAIYGKDEVFTFFFMLTEAYSNISRLDVALNTELSITKEEQTPFFEALNYLKLNIPIQYILGETEFYGLPFKVNESTLIPRPETEELVSLVVENLKNKNQNSKAHSVLDIGTGSGCIAISLAKNLVNTNIYALDVSAKTIEKAKENAKLNEVEVTFIEANVLNEENVLLSISKHLKNDKNLQFDTIVSNPPYVRNLEKKEMQPNVLQNEPHLALFVEDDNPLLFYKAISDFAIKNLKSNGELYFEINEYLGQEMITLLEDNGFKNIELKQDVFGKDRMIKGVKN